MEYEFSDGSSVEIIKRRNEYYKGSYCPAKVLSKVGNGYFVDYVHLYDKDGHNTLTDVVDADEIRPAYIPSKRRKRDYMSDYTVDFFHEGCWWLARPVKRLDDDHYILRKHYSGQEVQCHTDRIRIHREWMKDEKDNKMKFIYVDRRPTPEGQSSQSHLDFDDKSNTISRAQAEGTSADKSTTVTKAKVDGTSGSESNTASTAQADATSGDKSNMASMAQADGASGEEPNTISRAQTGRTRSRKSKPFSTYQTGFTFSNPNPILNSGYEADSDRTEETSGDDSTQDWC